MADACAEAIGGDPLLGRRLDGHASAVLGTHGHVTTTKPIRPGGTAYRADVGATDPDDFHRRPRLRGASVEVDPTGGRASAIRRVAIDRVESGESPT